MNTASKLLILCLAFSAGGCEKALFDNSMRKVVREKLKDPDSAKWGDVFTYKNRACLEVNSKNSYGGYTGNKSAWLTASGGSWRLEKIDDEICYESPLKALVELDEAEEIAEKKVIELLAKIGRNVSSFQLATINEDDPTSDKCVVQASKAMTAKRIAIKATGSSRETWEANYQSRIAPVISGACKG